jgi:hypothetical protein
MQDTLSIPGVKDAILEDFNALVRRIKRDAPGDPFPEAPQPQPRAQPSRAPAVDTPEGGITRASRPVPVSPPAARPVPASEVGPSSGEGTPLQSANVGQNKKKRKSEVERLQPFAWDKQAGCRHIILSP